MKTRTETLVDAVVSDILTQNIIYTKEKLQSKLQEEQKSQDDSQIQDFVILLRKKLLIVLDDEKDVSKNEAVYSNLILLATHWPVNSKCCFSQKTPDEKDKFFLASGYVCSATAFKELLLSGGAADIDISIYDSDKIYLIKHIEKLKLQNQTLYDRYQRIKENVRNLLIGVVLGGVIGVVVAGPLGFLIGMAIGGVVSYYVAPLLLAGVYFVKRVWDIAFGWQRSIMNAKTKPRTESKKSVECSSVKEIAAGLAVSPAVMAPVVVSTSPSTDSVISTSDVQPLLPPPVGAKPTAKPGVCP